MLVVLKVLLLISLSFFPVRLALARYLKQYGTLERILISFLFSFVLYFLCGLLSFYSGQALEILHFLVPAGLVLYGFLSKPKRLRAPLNKQELMILSGFTGAVLWIVLVQTSQVTYGGGAWYGDWYEHYERALIFGNQLAIDHRLLSGDHLTARPPLFNVLANFFMSWVGYEFYNYQLVSSLLGCTVFFPAALLFGCFLRTRPLCAGSTFFFTAATVLLLFHPATVINLIYPWTRMLSAVFVLAACYCFLAAIFDGRKSLISLAFLFLGSAHLTHYSADVVLVFLAGHAVYVVIKGTRNMRVLIFKGAILAAGLNLCWHVWPMAQYGFQKTVSSVHTLQRLGSDPLSALFSKVYFNLTRTLVPFSWDWDLRYLKQHDPGLALYAAAENGHAYWSSTLIGAIGEVPLLVFGFWFLWVCVRTEKLVDEDRPRGRNLTVTNRELWFLLALCGSAIVLSFPVTPYREEMGIAHLSLLPVCILLFLILAAKIYSQTRGMRVTFALLFALQAFVFYYLKTLDRIHPAKRGLLYSATFYENLRLKELHDLQFLCDQYVGLCAISREVILASVCVLGCIAVIISAKNTRTR